MKISAVRHAFAGDVDPNEYPDDSQRPLTSKGAKKFTKAAAGIGELVTPDVVLASPAARTLQTALLLQEFGKWPMPITSDALNDEDPQAVLDAIDALDPKPQHVGLVGHGPQLSTLLSYLLTGKPDRLALNMDKGGAAHVNVKGKLKAGAGELNWYMPPKSLKKHR